MTTRKSKSAQDAPTYSVELPEPATLNDPDGGSQSFDAGKVPDLDWLTARRLIDHAGATGDVPVERPVSQTAPDGGPAASSGDNPS